MMSVQIAAPQALARAKSYFSDVEFAMQLCGEFAAAESSDPALSAHLAEAHKMLERIVVHNAPLQSSPPDRQPTWPLHEALVRFDLPLHRSTSQLTDNPAWAPYFHVLRGRCLYYTDGKKEHADSHEGALAFLQSNPAPDGHYCMDLQGEHACCVTAGFAVRV